jgi:hypothetical protein
MITGKATRMYTKTITSIYLAITRSRSALTC